MRRKIFSYFVVLLCLLFLTSCGNKKKSEDKVKTYEIKWVVEGVTVETDSKVSKNEIPHFDGATPIKKETEGATYTFKGWSPNVSKAVKDQTYTAQFTETKKKI